MDKRSDVAALDWLSLVGILVASTPAISKQI